jgi:hypothetical protein
MDSIVSLPQQIVTWLGKQTDMSDLTFFVEYPPINKAVPLRKAIVAVGIESIDITDKFVANDDGVLQRQEYCRLAKIKAKLSICVPFSKGDQTCHDIFTRITDALTFRTNLNISESGCTNIESDRDTDALVMNGWFLMQADFCPAESTDENFASFLNKDLLCGSHINNNDIHVTLADKERWNNQYYIGFYMGSGSSSRTVPVDFKPSIVLLASGSYPPVTVDFANSSAKSYMAFANTSYGSQGLSITSTGFKISSSTVGGVTTDLNQMGMMYMYIAFK